jgi:hypothetical protein
MITIANAFSLNMLPSGSNFTVTFRVLNLEGAQAELTENYESYIGHKETADIVSGLLGVPIAFNRGMVKLGENDKLLVVQYNGPRLPEGATTLPPGASFSYWLVRIL